MPPTFQPRLYKWQQDGKSPYAPRFDKKDWEKHEKSIKTLHAEGRTKKEIIEVLDAKHGFRPSYCQIRTRLDKWFSRAKQSVQTSPPLSCLSENRGSTLKSCLNSLDRHMHLRRPTPESNVHPTQEEEQVFRTFTSILDDGPAENSNPLFDLSPVKSKRPRRGQHRSQQKMTLDLHSTSFVSSDVHNATNVTTQASEANRKDTHVASDIFMDSDDDETTESGLLLASNKIRKRRLCYNESEPGPDVTGMRKKLRLRLKCICCACGKEVHTRKCKNCQHERCQQCQSK